MSISIMVHKSRNLLVGFIATLCLILPTLSGVALNGNTAVATELPILAAGPINGSSHT